MVKNFTKDELVNGLLCKLRNGDVYMFLNNNLISNYTYILIDLYDNNLIHKNCENFDIMEIYVANSNFAFNNLINLKDCTIIFKREEKELTIRQIEELLGYPVKIVDYEKNEKEELNNLYNELMYLMPFDLKIPNLSNKEIEMYETMASLIDCLANLNTNKEN